MAWRKKINIDSDHVTKAFANWLSQTCMMVLSRFFYVVAGRGSSKTTDLQVERLIEMIYDMPGAPVVWVSDSYTNLQKNVLSTVMEGLKVKGLHEGIHYVKEKAPPVFTEAEKADLPPNIREHFWKPYNQFASYKHSIIFFTGLNITFASLDRPASLAGRNYVHVFGDEVKYFREDRIANLLKAVRGYRVKYGNSVFYRGHTMTTDMPDTTKIGQYDWILKQRKKMNSKMISMIIKLGMVVNESCQEYLVACEELEQARSNATNESVQELLETKTKKHRTWQRWLERWTSARLHPDGHTFFYIASSFVNADILTPAWFKDAFESDFSDNKTAILSMKTNTEAGELFYANIEARHFYQDGTNEIWADKFGLSDKEDCRILKYHDLNKAIDGGADFGNMMSLSLAQMRGKHYRVTNFIYALSPEWMRQWADKFIEFYKPHKEKTLNLYYDRAGNNYAKQKQDQATQIKSAIEIDADGKKTGWKVVLMSLGEGNIEQNAEYNFMQELFQENTRGLPKVLIDFHRCKPLRSSLELARTHINSKGEVVKDKKSEKLEPIKRLVLESTNPSDSFKYLMMRKSWRILVSGRKKPYTGTASVR